MNKEQIANICENLYKQCLKEIPQIQDNEIIWILNGSVLCNILANVKMIDGKPITEELHNLFYNFVRKPKGDIDICYKTIRSYKFNLKSQALEDFYNISDEKRTYNFVDSNDELNETDYNQLCLYKTNNDLEFYAKKPQFIFLYKFKEFVAIFHEQIIMNDLEKINCQRKNIIIDLQNLYLISCEYIGFENTYDLLFNDLYKISKYMHEIYISDKEKYLKIINSAVEIASNKKKMNSI